MDFVNVNVVVGCVNVGLAFSVTIPWMTLLPLTAVAVERLLAPAVDVVVGIVDCSLGTSNYGHR